MFSSLGLRLQNISIVCWKHSTALTQVGDFGLARLGESTAEGRVVTVMTEMVVGTSAYMAPEAYKGDVGPKMDVFSLGVVMLELLTGLPPLVEGEEARDIVSHLEEEMGEGATIEKCLDTRFSLMEWRQVVCSGSVQFAG